MSNGLRLHDAGWRYVPDSGGSYAKDGGDWFTEDEALVVVLTAERDAAIARAEAAEALAASRPDVSPEDAAAYREAMSISVDDISMPLGTVIAIRLDAALRAHAAKVSR